MSIRKLLLIWISPEHLSLSVYRLSTQDDGWPRFKSWFTIGNFWKQAPNDIARRGQYPSPTHINNASRANSLPFGKRLATSLRKTKTCFAVNGPSSGA